MNVLAITPARGGSKGVPRKNIKPLAGKPLVQYTIEAAVASPLIDRYIVNTEDEEIRALSESLGVETQGRPEEFYHDNTFQEVDRLLQWAVEDLEDKGAKIDVVVLLYATSPLRKTKHITECIDLVVNQGYDSALTLYKDHSYIWKREVSDNTVTPVNYDPKTRGPHQKEGWNQWIENKAVYVMKRDLLMESGCRLGGKIGYVEMSTLESIDIDRPEDFRMVELILRLREENYEI